MSGFILSVITVLLVIFIIIVIDAILKNRVSYIITSASEADAVEAQLRIIMKKNSESDIIVIDKTQSEESRQILDKLSHDFPQLHIVKADR